MIACSVLGLLLLGVLPIPPRFILPAPTGPYPVGTTSWHVTDATRRETFESGRRPREVEVLAWYPRSPASSPRSTTRAPYLRAGIAEARAFASLVRSPGAYDELAEVETHAVVDAAILPGTSKLPLLVFSHGYTGLISAYTSLLEDLASYGYVVLSVAHPYEVVATRRADGRVVTLLDPAGKLLPAVLSVVGEWSAEDSTMAHVTGETDPDVRRRILRAYIESVPLTNAVVDRWAKDTKLMLDRLSMLPSKSVSGRIVARIDRSRLGAFGHSMGGVVSGQFCIEDSRCAAALNLDGSPQSGSMIDATMRAPMLMTYSARAGRVGANDAIYRRAASRYYRVDVDSTLHLDFSDMNFWGGPLNRAHGPIAPLRAAEITRLIVREYFDQELRRQPSRLLDGTMRVPGVRVTARP